MALRPANYRITKTQTAALGAAVCQLSNPCVGRISDRPKELDGQPEQLL